ncbi:venom allergen 5-like [Strongylocentrotus purpuratus]|uniref:SCP domain-containing protein n=1 Tax=Strongylocentrotus purpuratus TaxID=7668 RepID=A0A7M7NLV7_STRPU|nr:venom allergen 5-like [Strongylocentrotus purpuratus]
MICALSLVLGLAVLQGGNGLTDDEKSQILAKHNEFRNEVQPPAANMLALRWSEKLANDAQSRANTCTTPGGMSVAMVDITRSFVSIIDSWNNEKENYDFNLNICYSTCDQYTRAEGRRPMTPLST